MLLRERVDTLMLDPSEVRFATEAVVILLKLLVETLMFRP